MKKIVALLLCGSVLCLTACGKKNDGDEPFSAKYAITSTSAPTVVFFDESHPFDEDASAPNNAVEAVEPDGLDFKQVFDFAKLVYFSEENRMVVKWPGEVLYTIEGKFQQEDTATIETIAEELSDVQGFFGMRRGEKTAANLVIRFTDDSVPNIEFSATESCRIKSATITIPSNASAQKKTVYLYRYMFRSLGIFGTGDTELDSLFSTSPASKPTDVDWLLLDTLYTVMDFAYTPFEVNSHFNGYYNHNR